MRDARGPRKIGLDDLRTKSEHWGMDDRDRLALYPFVVVRIGCRQCSRKGAYCLARLAAKFGPEITLRDLTNRFSYDCMWRAEARSKKGKSACGVYLPDLEHKRPPDLPPGMVKLKRGSRATEPLPLLGPNFITRRIRGLSHISTIKTREFKRISLVSLGLYHLIGCLGFP
jgi:hypothetical protein